MNSFYAFDGRSRVDGIYQSRITRHSQLQIRIHMRVNAFGRFFNSVNPASTWIYVYQQEHINDVLTSSFIAWFAIRLPPDAFNKKCVYKIRELVLAHVIEQKFQKHFSQKKREIDDARFKNHGNQKYSSKQYNTYNNNIYYIFITRCSSYICQKEICKYKHSIFFSL